MTRTLSLTDSQLAEINRAARTLLPSQRVDFLEALARRLGAEPSDDAVKEAIAATLTVNRIPSFASCGVK